MFQFTAARHSHLKPSTARTVINIRLIMRKVFYAIFFNFTFVVLSLHLSEAAKILSWVLPALGGHWSMSTLLRSISMPLVPLPKEKKKKKEEEEEEEHE